MNDFRQKKKKIHSYKKRKCYLFCTSWALKKKRETVLENFNGHCMV